MAKAETASLTSVLVVLDLSFQRNQLGRCPTNMVVIEAIYNFQRVQPLFYVQRTQITKGMRALTELQPHVQMHLKLATLLAFGSVFAGLASAHITIFPNFGYPSGGYSRLQLRIPHGKPKLPSFSASQTSLTSSLRFASLPKEQQVSRRPKLR